MEIKIVNYMIKESVDFLHDISLKGKQSRHRSRFIKLLKTRLEQLAEDEKIILMENCNLNEDGSLKQIEGTENLDMKDPAEYFKQQQMLLKEYFTIGSVEFQETIEAVKNILEEFDEEVSGNKAEIFNYLCDQFDI